ncbi:MAG: BON domain-containing protein [Rhodospirillales bacterium]|nr:BON domain-containing protein [Rhodospirillales bacterium]
MFRLSIMLVSGLALAFSVSPARALDLNPLTAIKSAIEAVVEDRSAEDIAKDTEIKAKIVVDVIDKMGADVISISADVYEQEVMLSGVVETGAQRAQADQLTRNIEGVKKLYNEIMVKSDLEEEKGAVENFVDDTVIETKINAQLLDAKGVNVTNFVYRSVGGHVFLFGRALSAEEKDKATDIARDIKGVVSVKNLAKVKPLED